MVSKRSSICEEQHKRQPWRQTYTVQIRDAIYNRIWSVLSAIYLPNAVLLLIWTETQSEICSDTWQEIVTKKTSSFLLLMFYSWIGTDTILIQSVCRLLSSSFWGFLCKSLSLRLFISVFQCFGPTDLKFCDFCLKYNELNF